MRRRQILRIHSAEDFLDLNAEKAKATKKALRENLNMHVVELDGGPKAQFLSDALNMLLVDGDYIDSEPEKVLTVGVAANGSISFRITIPAGETEVLIALTQKLQAWNEPAVDV